MHYLLTMPVIMDDSHSRELLGEIRKTSYEERVKQTLASMRIKGTSQAAGNAVGEIFRIITISIRAPHAVLQ